MSNRRRPANAKTRALRCPRCRCCDISTKSWADGAQSHVCDRCQHAWQVIREEATDGE